MKKVLMILGGVFLVLIIIAILGLVSSSAKINNLGKEAKAFVDQTVPIICSDFNFDSFKKYASNELLNSESPSENEKLFGYFKKLGKFVTYEGSSGFASMNYHQNEGNTITGIYTAKAEFETGPAEIYVQTIKIGDAWLYYSFKIDSKVFLAK
jgi:hypothetical protein